jgi:hypothetical protein
MNVFVNILHVTVPQNTDQYLTENKIMFGLSDSIMVKLCVWMWVHIIFYTRGSQPV